MSAIFGLRSENAHADVMTTSAMTDASRAKRVHMGNLMRIDTSNPVPAKPLKNADKPLSGVLSVLVRRQMADL
jgi:hypothetical protein